MDRKRMSFPFAQILQPILQSASVKVHAYRKLRWGGKTGLLVEVA